jgi:VanZ family protein
MVLMASRAVSAAWRVPVPIRWLPVLLWAGLIFLLSAQPGLHVSADPGVDRPIREFAHICTYAVLTILTGWALAGHQRPSRRVVLIAAVLAFLYGISDEWHQTYVPSRSGRPQDLVWDGIGIVIGCAVLWAAARLLDRDASPTRS